MAPSLGALLRHLRKLTASPDAEEWTDRQLVHRLAVEHDQAAFAEVVERHGPVVLAVCRQVLQQEQDAEDAFQATFLILALKAGSIRKGESLASWLHGVAYRTAMKARRDAARRRLHEDRVRTASQDPPGHDLAWREVQAILHEEIDRLPAKYRAAFVLCCLESVARAEAARQLGVKEGTVSSRLAHARKVLQDRLALRGVTLSAVLAVLALTPTATASVPRTLLENTLQALSSLTAAPAVLGLSTRSMVLAQGVLQAMLITRLQIGVLLLVIPVLIAGAIGLGGRYTAPAAPAAEKPAEAEEQPAKERGPTPANESAEPGVFQDVTKTTGIDFRYHNGAEAGHLAPLEEIGGGVALIDYDGDGLLDVFLVGGGEFGGPDRMEIKGRPNRLYKNLGNGRFRDVTKETGLDQPLFYGHGCAVADFNCDGWPDLLVTGWGRVVLYRNSPDGKGGRRFVDVTKQAGLPEGLWTTSAAWGDLDGDGYPDLYLCQYHDWDLRKNHPEARYGGKERDVAPPKSFRGLPHKLFRNNGDGTFTDVSKEAGLRDGAIDASKGLGVIFVDVDGDGKPDIYVANDTVDKFLYINHSTPGKLKFEEVGLFSGAARDDRGQPNGSHGVGAADCDGSGRPSLWVTNYQNEMHALYRNECKAGMVFFSHCSATAGIAAIGQKFVGWGTGFLDFDNDGWEDLVIVNGHDQRSPLGRGTTRGQQPTLFRNAGKGKFKDWTHEGGAYFARNHVGRGLAIGDFDNDGRADLIISHLDERVALLHNQAARNSHWLGIELIGKDHRDVVGARVVVEVGERRLTRFAQGGGSYLSSGDRRLLFGLGPVGNIDRLTVTWPGGKNQSWNGASKKLDRYWRVVEGQEPVERPGRRP